MHSLVLFAHPQPESLTAAAARALAAELSTGDGDTAEVADIAGEGFDPRFTATDLAAMRGQNPVAADVRREQERVERADAVVLVYPVYWWGMPGLLKGWIDRVVSYGWAYGDDEVHADALARRDIHLLALAGVDSGTYDRHGYTESMRTGIEHGIFEYCGTTVASSHVIYNTEGSAPISLADNIAAVAKDVMTAHEQRLCKTGVGSS
ncbi:NAD(P)H-dependent oxidoreductase [Mycobacterium sp. AMU20-3851]|uniref:NAD(P)H-dependent oxidoreductase n=1 Tax=Mycobacterium sp. AMU20-3851 TaxID=3122055 RepID=UPI003754B8EF